jgi:hypothetical protein
VDFGEERILSEIELYFLDDGKAPAREVTGEEEGSGFPLDRLRPEVAVLPPLSYQILAWNGATQGWEEVPGQERRPEEPSGRRANAVSFPQITTPGIRVLLRPQEGATVGLTELEAWGPPESYAGDSILSGENLAWNPGGRAYPRIRASFTSPSDLMEQAIDGHIAFTRYSRNRWSAQGSPNGEDWLEVDFGKAVTAARVEIFLLADGRGLAAPRSLRLQRWTEDGWKDITPTGMDPTTPTPWARNDLNFDPVETRRMRILFRHGETGATGVTELRILPPGESQG